MAIKPHTSQHTVYRSTGCCTPPHSKTFRLNEAVVASSFKLLGMTQPRIYSHLSTKDLCSQADGCKSRCICKKAFDKGSLVCYCLESNDVLHSSIWEQLVADSVATGGCRVTSQWPESSKKSRLIYDITIDTIEVRLGGSTAYSSGRMKRTVKQLQTKGVEKK